MKLTDRPSVPPALRNPHATEKGRLDLVEALDWVVRRVLLGRIPVLALVQMVIVAGVAVGSPLCDDPPTRGASPGLLPPADPPPEQLIA